MKRADCAAMRRSQASAKEKPAPAAGPFTMAMVGFGISCNKREISILPRKRCTASSMPNWVAPSAILLTSPPAQKPRPAPVNTTTAISGSAPSRGKASSRPSLME